MDPLSFLYFVLAVSALVFSIGVAIALLGIQKSLERLTNRLDETFKQVEITMEDVRKTNTVLLGIASNVDHAAANFAHLTDGVRHLRGTVDIASKVVHQSVSPLLIGLAGGLAGLKAAVSHIAQRISGNSGKETGK
ncbi:MAG: hypothetical protein FWH25_03265 [Syntrophorhabdaceae bacterium]|nr:hypothetical protein [Syntrophorhabdaceae bacterium]